MSYVKVTYYVLKYYVMYTDTPNFVCIWFKKSIFGLYEPGLWQNCHSTYTNKLYKRSFSISCTYAPRQLCLVYLVELLFRLMRFHKKWAGRYNCWKICFPSSWLNSWLNSDLFRLQTLVSTTKNVDFEYPPKRPFCGFWAVLTGIQLWPTMRYKHVFVV